MKDGSILDYVQRKKIPLRKKTTQVAIIPHLIEPIIPSEPSARDILLLSTADVDQNTTNNTNTDKKKLEAVSLFSTEIVESKGPKLLLSKRRFEDIESLTPPVLVDSSPITFQAPKEKPAYKRFAHLISKTTLELPLELQNLIKIFVALESVLNYLKSRDTIAIFHKIQQSVQNQAGVNFELKHLAQIVYIYPEAYKLSSVNVLVRDKRVPSLSIEFMNDVLKEEFVKNLDRASQPLQTGSKISTISSASSNKDMMTAVTEFVKQIPIRRQKMEELLIEHVKKEHQLFLEKNGLTWEFSTVKPSWHPQFDLNSVSSIPQAELPIKKVTTSYPLRPVEKVKEVVKVVPTPEPKPATQDGEIPKVSRSKALLERIREKERLRKQHEAENPKESPELLKRKSMMKRLVPIASSLHMFAKGKGKTVVPAPVAINHLQQSFADYFCSQDQWFEHLQLLAELVPGFCTMEVLVNCKDAVPLKPEHYLLRFPISGRMKLVNDTMNSLIK